ncbi:MAG: hypothetical protein AAGB93_19075 [Planctomycetota bacterium]
MSPIGRTAVFLNLALSAGFLGWAAANLADADKYRAQFDAKTSEMAQLEADTTQQIADLTAERDENARQRTDMRNLKDASDVRVTALTEQLNEKTDELNQLKANMANIASTIGDLNSNLEDMKSQVAQANDARVEAVEARRSAENERDDAMQAKAEATDRANGLEVELQTAEKGLTAAQAKIQDLETSVDTIVRATGFDITAAGGAVPQIDGAVLQYYSDLKLVHINRGSDDQVKRGFVFDIWNAGQYKGRAQVEVVNPGSCTARIINAVPGTQVVQGDRVSTQI